MTTVVPTTFLFLSVALAQSPPSAPPASTDSGIPTWEIALAVGSGTMALLLCAYAIFIVVRRNREADRLEEIVLDKAKAQAPKEPAKTPAPPATKAPAKAPAKTPAPPATKAPAKAPAPPAATTAPIAKKAAGVPPPPPEVKRPEVTRVDPPATTLKKITSNVREVVADRRGSAPGRLAPAYNARNKKVPGSNKAPSSTRAAVVAMQERRVVSRGNAGATGDDAPGSAATRVGRRI